jgi:hypothetical protein
MNTTTFIAMMHVVTIGNLAELRDSSLSGIMFVVVAYGAG